MALKAAVIAGNRNVVQSLLKQGTDVNTPDALGRTPLSWAAQYGHEEVVLLLLKVPKVKPNFLDNSLRGPLSWAAQYGHDTVVKHILERFLNDDILLESDSPDMDGRTPLSYAAGFKGRFHDRFLDAEFFGTDFTFDGPYPFPFPQEDIAAWTNKNLPDCEPHKRVIIARMLLEAGANPESADKRGRTPFLWASLTKQKGLKHLYVQRLVNLYLQEGVNSNHGGDSASLLFLAVALDYEEGVNELLSNVSDLDPNTKDEFGETPLCCAIRKGSTDAATALILHPNIDPNAKNDTGDTPLCLAIGENHEATVKELLVHSRIDPNMKDGSGQTPLLIVVQQCRYPKRAIPILREVLRHPKIDPNVKGHSGKTPLSIAAQFGCLSSVRELLQHEKTDLNTMDDLGRTPLLFAIESKNESVVSELLQHPEIDCRSQDSNGRTPAWAAVQTGTVEITKLLFERMKINPNFRNQSGQTPLLYAAKYGNQSLVEFLLMNEMVDPDSKDEKGRTALFLAVQYDHNETVKVLLDPAKTRGKVTIDSQNNAGWTPLSYAASRGHAYVVSLLLGTGCIEPDTPTHDGRTPLSLAAENGHLEVVKLLTHNGANPNFKDKGGRTPLDLAMEGDSSDDIVWPIVLHLLETGADLDANDSKNQMLLQCAAETGFDWVALELLSKMEFHDRTPLSWASETGSEAIVELLLAQDTTEVDSKDKGGRTALWRAADARQRSVMKLLAPKDNTTLTVLVQEGNELGVRFMLDAGCKVNMTDPLDRTLLHVAVLHRQHRLLEDIIKAGVDINAKDSDERTAIRLAVEEQETEAIKVLLKFSAETELIMADQWSHAYQKVDTNAIHPNAIHLFQRECGAEAPRFFGKSVDLETPEVGNAKLRQIFIFESILPWKSHWIPGFEWNWPHRPTVTSTAQKLNSFTPRQGSHSSSRYLVSTETKEDNQQWTTFTLVALAPLALSGEPKQNDKFLEGETWETLAITWTMLPIRNNQRTSGWVSIDYFSMLRNGWIPKDNVEFVTHFVSSLNEKWVHLCDRADEHLARRRADQLEKKGLSNKLINHLAEDALAWTQLRNILKDQTHALNTFASRHCRRYSKKKGLQDMQQVIRHFAEAVEIRLDALDQTVRDLLQLEFAWVSVVEAHRSTGLSVSMKRLSWITLIFLPPMFASSLFGMNVDVLASNPDWRWYPLFSVVFLLVTLVGWLTFKSVEPRAEQGLIRIGAEFNKRFRNGGPRTGSVSDIEMNPFN